MPKSAHELTGTTTKFEVISEHPTIRGNSLVKIDLEPAVMPTEIAEICQRLVASGAQPLLWRGYRAMETREKLSLFLTSVVPEPSQDPQPPTVDELLYEAEIHINTEGTKQ